MTKERPKLTDPKEFATIRSVYFKDNIPEWEKLDPLERLDRIESKQRFNQKSSR